MAETVQHGSGRSLPSAVPGRQSPKYITDPIPSTQLSSNLLVMIYDFLLLPLGSQQVTKVGAEGVHAE
jgi:hypothetical protein